MNEQHNIFNMITSNTPTHKNMFKHIETKVAIEDFNKIGRLIEAGLYNDISDFLKSAVKEKLGCFEEVDERDIPREQAVKEIREYCKERDTLYLTDIVDDLRLDLELVYGIVDELIKDGTLMEVD